MYELEAVEHWLWQPTQSLEKPSLFQIDDQVGAVPLVVQPLDPEPLLPPDPLLLLELLVELPRPPDDPLEDATPNPPELLPPEPLLADDEPPELELPPPDPTPASATPAALELLEEELPPPLELDPWTAPPLELDPVVDVVVSASTSVVSLPPTPAGAVPLVGETRSPDVPPYGPPRGLPSAPLQWTLAHAMAMTAKEDEKPKRFMLSVLAEGCWF